jgi:hypothetical protein
VRKHKCEECDYESINKSDVVKHIVRIHQKSEVLTKMCCFENCDFEYTSKNQFYLHKRTKHERVIGFLCPICRKISSRGEDAKKHLITGNNCC